MPTICEGREPAGVHCGDADDQLMHEGGECGVNHKQQQHRQAHFAPQTARQRQQRRNNQVACAAETERAPDFVAAAAYLLLVVAAAADHHHHLNQRHQPRADHDAVRQKERVDIDAGNRLRIGAHQKAHPEHAQRPDIADKGGAESGHRDLQH